MSFVQNSEFDWLLGHKKGKKKHEVFRKMLKEFLLRNHTVDEADTFHTGYSLGLGLARVRVTLGLGLE